MREAEIAALRDEFFSDEFDHSRAVTMLGSVISRDSLGDGVVTYLRPDARSLARVEVHSVSRASVDAADFVHRVVCQLRSPHVYSRETLRDYLGEGRETQGPAGPDGTTCLQIVFDRVAPGEGEVILRWWPTFDDPTDVRGMVNPRQLRADEVIFERAVPMDDHVDDNDVIPDEDVIPDPTYTNRGISLARSRFEPVAEETITRVLATDDVLEPDSETPGFSIDDAMDNGAWAANLAWQLLQPDVDLARAHHLCMADPADSTRGDGGIVIMRPRDPRVAVGLVSHRAGLVDALRLEVRGGQPIAVALDVIAERLEDAPEFDRGVVRFRVERERATGMVSLLTDEMSEPAAFVYASGIEVVRA